MITVSITNRNNKKKSKIKIDKGVISIGRLSKNDIYLDSPAVSRKHAELILIDRDFYLVDHESGNGTFLNQQKLIPHEKTKISSEDIIRIEEFELQIDYELPELGENILPSEEYTDHGVIEIKMLKKVLSALDEKDLPSFEVTFPENLHKKIYFSENLEELIIGREEICHLRVDSHLVSRKHAICKRKWGGIAIKDCKSKNLTKVNGQVIDEAPLHDGDQIIVGDVEIIFRNPQEINFEELSRDYEEEEPSVIKKSDDDFDDESYKSDKNKISDLAKQTINEDDDHHNQEKNNEDDLEENYSEKNNSPIQLPLESTTNNKNIKKEELPKPIKKKKKRKRMTCLEFLFMLGGMIILAITSYLLYILLQ